MDPNSPQAQAQAMHMFAAMLPLIGLFAIICIAVIVFPLWKICTKAGLSGALSLLVIVPFGILIVLYIVAFSQWKIMPTSDTVVYPPSYPPPTNYPPAS
jgi:hypothetical protein